MESSRSKAEEERIKQEEIRRKIEELQSQLRDIPADSIPAPSHLSPKRKRKDDAFLVPPTPSPKKKRRRAETIKKIRHTSSFVDETLHTASVLNDYDTSNKGFTKPPPSNLLNRLATTMNRRETQDTEVFSVHRSSRFAEKPPAITANEDEDETFGGQTTVARDERLALIEEIAPGPVDHTPPFDDPNFDKLEPNSGIRLCSRSVSHEDLQEYLRGRFFISPSQLYSVIRLLPDKQAYDVPVPGDWITIAVVAERGPIKFTRAPVTISQTEGDHNIEDGKGKARKNHKDSEVSKPSGKKFVNVKLVDFGARAKSASSATGGKATIRGDAFLSLLLFESDRFDLATNDGESREKKVYRGGSGGAFEALEKVKEGDVIAVMNPRVLKPYQRSNVKDPHPTNNILAITPQSAESIMTIGRARDLGMCSVMKKDEKICGSWYDKRVSNVCEYHVQHAVQRRRAGRAEFSASTMGMSTTSARPRKPAYDPANNWGLKPADDAGGTTYVVSGHIVRGSKWDSIFTAENIGREGQAKAKRKLSTKDADRALMNLLQRDKEGMRAVICAREVGKRKNSSSRKKVCSEEDEERSGEKENGDQPAEFPLLVKATYSAQVIKNLGFDPSVKVGQQRPASSLEIQKKLKTLEVAQSARKSFALGPRPGPRIRSGVKAPVTSTKDLKRPPDLDSDRSDQELPVDLYCPQEPMVDLDED